MWSGTLSITLRNKSRSVSSARSMRLGSVTSRTTLENPRRFPSRSRNAVMTMLARKRDPSLRNRQPSSSKHPSAAATCSCRSGLPLAMLALWHQPGQRLTQSLLLAITEHRLRASVPRDDVALTVGGDDGVVRALRDRAITLLALAMRFLGAPPHANLMVEQMKHREQ